MEQAMQFSRRNISSIFQYILRFGESFFHLRAMFRLACVCV